MDALIRDLMRSVGEGPLGPFTVPARWALVFYRELRRDKAFVRAAGMAYQSLVAIVPTMILAYGVLGAVGAGETDVDVAFGAIIDQMFGQVPGVRDVLLPGLRRVDLRALGVISIGGLLLVAANLYLMVEQAYCDMFGVPVRRKMGYRLLIFYFTMTVAPVLLVTMTRGTFVLAGEHTTLRALLGLVLQYAVLVSALKLFPAIHVRWAPALIGALVSFTLMEVGRWGFQLYITLFATDDPLQIVYGSLGLVPLFLLWLYLIWVFVLLGVEVANVIQNYTSLYEAELALLQSEQLKYPSVDGALQVARAIGRAFVEGEGALPVRIVAERCGLEGRVVSEIARVLVTGKVLVGNEDGWLPARPPDDIANAEVVQVWRAATVYRADGDPLHERIDARLALPGSLLEPLPPS